MILNNVEDSMLGENYTKIMLRAAVKYTLLVMKWGQGPWKPLRSGILKAGQLLSVVIPAKMMLLSFSKEIAPRSPTSASPSGQRQMVWAG